MSAMEICEEIAKGPKMEVVTPEILWHGGGLTGGKVERVFSVYMLGAILITTG